MSLQFEEIGQGMPVVLIHAFPLSRQMWQPQAAALARHNFRVILPDLPGFGERSSNFGRLTMEVMARKVAELLESLNIEKAIIGGLSMGGYVLFNLFRIAPDKFSAMILCDTTHLSDTAEKKKGRFELISKIEQQGSTALVENMLPNLISDKTKLNNPRLKADLEAFFMQVNPASAVNALQGMAERRDSTDIAGNIKVPTLLVFGEFDTVTNLENAKKMNELINGSELQIIKDAGHYSNLENPAAFNTVLLDFCQRVRL